MRQSPNPVRSLVTNKSVSPGESDTARLPHPNLIGIVIGMYIHRYHHAHTRIVRYRMIRKAFPMRANMTCSERQCEYADDCDPIRLTITS